MPSPIRVQFEAQDFLQDIQNVNAEYGIDVDFYLKEESEIQRDLYGSIKSTDILPDFTIPCMFNSNPSQYDLQKAGIFEQVSAICYVATKDFLDRGKTIDDINVNRTTLQIDGDTYIISSKNNSGQIGSVYVNIILGVNIK